MTENTLCQRVYVLWQPYRTYTGWQPSMWRALDQKLTDAVIALRHVAQKALA